MKTCENCGLGIIENESPIRCFKYKTLNNPPDDKESCLYYIELICEEGEPLSPLQHLLLKEEELKARKMKRCRIKNIDLFLLAKIKNCSKRG